jgi:thiamine pyrophosphate-dependent acetolactate synthase large subunit-like protein
MTGQPVAVCGTAGAGTAHLLNGLMDARKERAPVIAIAGDAKGYTLSMARQILSGKMDEVIRTIEHNVRLV